MIPRAGHFEGGGLRRKYETTAGHQDGGHAAGERADKIVEGPVPGGKTDFYYAAVFKEGVATPRAFASPIWMDDN